MIRVVKNGDSCKDKSTVAVTRSHNYRIEGDIASMELKPLKSNKTIRIL